MFPGRRPHWSKAANEQATIFVSRGDPRGTVGAAGRKSDEQYISLALAQKKPQSQTLFDSRSYMMIRISGLRMDNDPGRARRPRHAAELQSYSPERVSQNAATQRAES